MSTTTPLRSWLIPLIALLAGYLLATHLNRPAPAPPQLPALSLHSIDGHGINLAALRGRPVLVTFWSITCAPCLEEIPSLIEMHRALGAQGLAMIAVAMDYDPPDQVLALAHKRHIPYDIVLDPMGQTVAAFGGIDATPTTLLFDAQGHGVRRIVGGFDPKQLRAQISALLPAATPAHPAPAHALD